MKDTDEQAVTKELADQIQRTLEHQALDALAGRPATTSGMQPAGLTGTGLTLQALMQEWWKLEDQLHQACPWMRWVGKVELRVDEAGWLPADWPGVSIQLPDGTAAVYVKPAALTEVKKAWAELAAGHPYSHLFAVPTDQELAAMFAWLAEVQAARTREKPRGGILNLDQV